MERKEMRKIFNVLKKEFGLDQAHTVGKCCHTCSVYEYYGDGNNRVIFNKQFVSGLNQSDWRDDIFYIAYNSDYLPHSEMNLIGKRFTELAKQFFDQDYYYVDLTSDDSCLELIKLGGYYDKHFKRTL